MTKSIISRTIISDHGSKKKYLYKGEFIKGGIYITISKNGFLVCHLTIDSKDICGILLRTLSSMVKNTNTEENKNIYSEEINVLTKTCKITLSAQSEYNNQKVIDLLRKDITSLHDLISQLDVLKYML